MRIIRSVLPHITIILSGIFIVLLILDNYNPTMNFLSNPVSTYLFWAYCILSIINSIIIVAVNRKAWKEKKNDRND
jgi:hypothetical protein